MKIFLDDHRHPEDVYSRDDAQDMIVLRNYNAFVAVIEADGLPEFISFDFDLGLDFNGKFAPTGLDCAKWLVQQFPSDYHKIKYKVHSSYPKAQELIEGILTLKS